MSRQSSSPPDADARPRRNGRWEPKRLRTRLFTVPATLVRTGRRRLLHLADHHPWGIVVYDAVLRLRALNADPMTAPG
jgi:hypothetical protein